MPATGFHLLYFADPMCSWCWGFSPVIETIRAHYAQRLPVQLIMGGLRPGSTEPVEKDDWSAIRSHWEHVREASGQPFDFGFFHRERFVYDTEPASRAVVVARRDGAIRGFQYLRTVHAAFYTGNRDVTDPEVLAEIAGEIGFDRDIFMERLATDDAREETQRDFQLARKAGISGFPTLIAGTGKDGVYSLITQGFQPADRIIPVIDHWLAQQAKH